MLFNKKRRVPPLYKRKNNRFFIQLFLLKITVISKYCAFTKLQTQPSVRAFMSCLPSCCCSWAPLLPFTHPQLPLQHSFVSPLIPPSSESPIPTAAIAVSPSQHPQAPPHPLSLPRPTTHSQPPPPQSY